MRLGADERGYHSLSTSNPKHSRIPRLVLVAILFSFLTSAAYSLFIFDGVPHIPDEIGYLFQAKIFKLARLYVPSPCSPESFDFPHVVNNGRWYSMYPPGFPFLLLFGLILGVPWIVNPVIGALAILLLYLLGKEIYGRKTGILAAILGATSIWRLIMSATMMSHAASMLFNGLFLLFAVRSIRRPALREGLLAGAALGFAFLIRPYNTALFSFVILLYLSILFLQSPRRRIGNMAGMVGVALLFLAAFLLYNWGTNGSPLKTGYIERFGQAGIFPAELGRDGVFTPYRGFKQIGTNLASINKLLLGWPISSLLALFPFFASMKRRREQRSLEIIFLSLITTMIVGFYFYWGAFLLIGARMFYEVFPILIVFSAQGIIEVSVWAKARVLKLKLVSINSGFIIVLSSFTAYSFIVTAPRWIKPPGTDSFFHRLDYQCLGSTASINRTIRAVGIRHAIVIMKILYVPVEDLPPSKWSSGFMFDSPGLDDDIVYAVDRGEKNIRLIRCFSDRQAYIYYGTVDRGFLAPLTLENDRLAIGPPILGSKEGRRSVGLANSPTQIFRLYSPDFAEFIKRLFKENSLSVIDAEWLIASGNAALSSRDWRSAAFAFEAVLQIENASKIRFIALNGLIAGYNRTGQSREAAIVSARIKRVFKNRLQVYNILPERGF